MRTVTLALGLALALVSGCVVAPPTATPPAGVYPPSAGYYGEPPPPLPFYEQPPVPMDGYLWTPGYWGMGPAGYTWVPGAWVAPPAPGLLWTPGYWVASGRSYVFHPGYWGPHVGYYGGINYGHGYFGNGYAGGRWNNNRFQYNTVVTNVGRTTIRDSYNQTVVNNTDITRVTRASYVGGANTRARPTAEEEAAAREAHRPPTAVQVQHETAARSDPQRSAARIEGRSGIETRAADATADRPPPANPATSGRPRDLPQAATQGAISPAPASIARQSSGPTAQPELQARHEQERRALAQQQEQDRANFARQPDHDQRAFDAMENRHQQQAQQLQQRQQQENARAPRNDATGSGPDVTH